MHGPKLWRLTKAGRDLVGVEYEPIPFTAKRVWHVVGVGDCYLDLKEMGGLGKVFDVELREAIKFSPDAFFGFRKQSYLLEYQRSPLSKNRWGEKWKKAEAFYRDHLKSASWQRYSIKGVVIRPIIVVVTNQDEGQVLAKPPRGVDVIVLDDIKKLGR